MIRFKTSDQRKVPEGLKQTFTTEVAKPPEYYRALRN